MFSQNDRYILRELAKKVDEISSLPIMDERRDLWTRHNSLERVRPVIFISPEGSWSELIPQSALKCEGEEARKIEWELRRRIYYHEHINDDTVIERTYFVDKVVSDSGWGLEPKYIDSTTARGSWTFDPVIKDRSDLEKLKHPKVTYHEEQTKKNLEKIQDLFGDILDVKLSGIRYISFHLTSIYCRLRGLEQVMWDMYDNPEMLHEAMSFLEEGYKQQIQQYIDLNLLTLNNDGTYHSSGGVGYTTELPKPGFNPEKVLPRDMWASAESQEMAQVSPQMHEEFVMQYERRLLEPFGLNGYGCCEDLTRKLDYVLKIPNIRRVSISPWADVEKCAERIGQSCIFSWKPQPSHLVGTFDEDMIEKYIKHALDATKDCVVEIILKDTHTCENRPERFTKWTNIARKLVSNMS